MYNKAIRKNLVKAASSILKYVIEEDTTIIFRCLSIDGIDFRGQYFTNTYCPKKKAIVKKVVDPLDIGISMRLGSLDKAPHKDGNVVYNLNIGELLERTLDNRSIYVDEGYRKGLQIFSRELNKLSQLIDNAIESFDKDQEYSLLKEIEEISAELNNPDIEELRKRNLVYVEDF